MWKTLSDYCCGCLLRGVSLTALVAIVITLATLLQMPLPAVTDRFGHIGNLLLGVIPMFVAAGVGVLVSSLILRELTRFNAMCYVAFILLSITAYIVLLYAVRS